MRNAYRIFVVKYTGRRFFSIHSHDREGNVKLYLKETGYVVWPGFIWMSAWTSIRLL